MQFPEFETLLTVKNRNATFFGGSITLSMLSVGIKLYYQHLIYSMFNLTNSNFWEIPRINIYSLKYKAYLTKPYFNFTNILLIFG